eukprot:jgi/Chlat1/493/Chrsp103S00985
MSGAMISMSKGGDGSGQMDGEDVDPVALRARLAEDELATMQVIIGQMQSALEASHASQVRTTTMQQQRAQTLALELTTARRAADRLTAMHAEQESRMEQLRIRLHQLQLSGDGIDAQSEQHKLLQQVTLSWELRKSLERRMMEYQEVAEERSSRCAAMETEVYAATRALADADARVAAMDETWKAGAQELEEARAEIRQSQYSMQELAATNVELQQTLQQQQAEVVALRSAAHKHRVQHFHELNRLREQLFATTWQAKAGLLEDTLRSNFLPRSLRTSHNNNFVPNKLNSLLDHLVNSEATGRTEQFAQLVREGQAALSKSQQEREQLQAERDAVVSRSASLEQSIDTYANELTVVKTELAQSIAAAAVWRASADQQWSRQLHLCQQRVQRLESQLSETRSHLHNAEAAKHAAEQRAEIDQMRAEALSRRLRSIGVEGLLRPIVDHPKPEEEEPTQVQRPDSELLERLRHAERSRDIAYSRANGLQQVAEELESELLTVLEAATREADARAASDTAAHQLHAQLSDQKTQVLALRESCMALQLKVEALDAQSPKEVFTSQQVEGLLVEAECIKQEAMEELAAAHTAQLTQLNAQLDEILSAAMTIAATEAQQAEASLEHSQRLVVKHASLSLTQLTKEVMTLRAHNSRLQQRLRALQVSLGQTPQADTNGDAAHPQQRPMLTMALVQPLSRAHYKEELQGLCQALMTQLDSIRVTASETAVMRATLQVLTDAMLSLDPQLRSEPRTDAAIQTEHAVVINTSVMTNESSSDFEVKLSKLKDRCTAASAKLSVAENKVSTLAAHEQDLKSRLQHSAQAMQAAEVELQKCKAELTRQKRMLGDTEHALSESKTAHAAACAKLQQLAAEHEKLKAENAAGVASNAAGVQDLQQRLLGVDKKLAEERETHLAMVAALRGTLVGVETQASEQKQQLAHASSQLAALSQHNATLKQQLRLQCKRAHTQRKQLKAQYSSHLKTMHAQLKELSARFYAADKRVETLGGCVSVYICKHEEAMGNAELLSRQAQEFEAHLVDVERVSSAFGQELEDLSAKHLAAFKRVSESFLLKEEACKRLATEVDDIRSAYQQETTALRNSNVRQGEVHAAEVAKLLDHCERTTRACDKERKMLLCQHEGLLRELQLKHSEEAQAWRDQVASLTAKLTAASEVHSADGMATNLRVSAAESRADVAEREAEACRAACTEEFQRLQMEFARYRRVKQHEVELLEKRMVDLIQQTSLGSDDDDPEPAKGPRKKRTAKSKGLNGLRPDEVKKDQIGIRSLVISSDDATSGSETLSSPASADTHVHSEAGWLQHVHSFVNNIRALTDCEAVAASERQLSLLSAELQRTRQQLADSKAARKQLLASQQRMQSAERIAAHRIQELEAQLATASAGLNVHEKGLLESALHTCQESLRAAKADCARRQALLTARESELNAAIAMLGTERDKWQGAEEALARAKLTINRKASQHKLGTDATPDSDNAIQNLKLKSEGMPVSEAVNMSEQLRAAETRLRELHATCMLKVRTRSTAYANFIDNFTETGLRLDFAQESLIRELKAQIEFHTRQAAAALKATEAAEQNGAAVRRWRAESARREKAQQMLQATLDATRKELATLREASEAAALEESKLKTSTDQQVSVLASRIAALCSACKAAIRLLLHAMALVRRRGPELTTDDGTLGIAAKARAIAKIVDFSPDEVLDIMQPSRGPSAAQVFLLEQAEALCDRIKMAKWQTGESFSEQLLGVVRSLEQELRRVEGEGGDACGRMQHNAHRHVGIPVE